MLLFIHDRSNVFSEILASRIRLVKGIYNDWGQVLAARIRLIVVVNEILIVR